MTGLDNFQKGSVKKHHWETLSVASPPPRASVALESHLHLPMDYVLIPACVPAPKIAAKDCTKMPMQWHEDRAPGPHELQRAIVLPQC